MALQVCQQCTAAYAVGLPCCPQCGSTDHQEDSMPKISSNGTVSFEPGSGQPSAATAEAEDTAAGGTAESAAAQPATEPAPEAAAAAETGAEQAAAADAPAKPQPKKADT